MHLTSAALRWALVATAVAVPLAALWLWPRARGPRWLRGGQRLGLIAVAQALAVFLTFVAVNDSYGFYTSWGDLLGKPSSAPAIVSGTTSSGPLRGADGGRLLQYRDFRGPASGIEDPVLVHLPPEYDEPAYAHRAFPVVEFLAGWRGYPRSWISQMLLLDDLARLEKQHQVRPFISVFPTVNVALPRDTECTDVPHSTKAFSWLARDVPLLVRQHFRVLSKAASWAAVGYSTGGYCAAKLAFLAPQRFHVAAALSAYFDALKDDTTGDLWGGSQQVRDHNDLLWLSRHGLHPASDVLVFTTKEDSSSYGSTKQFLALSRPPTRTFSIIAAHGGHNLKVLRVSLPEVLVWVSAHLSALVAP
ncbi:MAG: alpha/beta hydrolase [Mycobacteriales bacterium]